MTRGVRRFIGMALIAGLAGALAAPAVEATDAEPSAEQKAMMETWAASMTPGPEHAGLADLAGTWRVRTTVWMAPGAAPEVGEAEAVRTMVLGGRVLREEFAGTFQGQPFTGLGYTGYDTVTGRYWSTWMDNTSTGVGVFRGRRDAATGLWIFDGESSDPVAGGPVPIRIETRMEGREREISDFYKPGPDGEMVRMMELAYERQ